MLMLINDEKLYSQPVFDRIFNLTGKIEYINQSVFAKLIINKYKNHQDKIKRKMEFFKRKYDQTKKSFKQYMYPNQNPTDKDKKAFQLLDRGEVDMFIEYMECNPDVNLNVADFNKASLLIKAQDVANNSNQYKKKIEQPELMRRAVKAIEYLLKRGVDINYRDKNGITALLAACHWGNYDTVQLLLDQGADPNIGSNTNNFYTTPLLSSYFKKNMKIVILLLKNGVDVQQTIKVNQKSNGFKLQQEDIDFLRSAHNVALLTRKRQYDISKKKQNLLTMISDVVFEDICYNI